MCNVFEDFYVNGNDQSNKKLTRTEAEGIVREYRKEAASQIGG
jgi:hypothetical protein